MILTNGSVMIICVNVLCSVTLHSVLCQKKKKILQVNITAASDRELNLTPNRSQSIFYFILHIYSPSCATLPR